MRESKALKVRWLLLSLVVSVIVAGGVPLPGQGVEEFVVVVNRSVPVTFLSKADLADIFLKKTSHWKDGSAVAPVDLASDSPTRASFSESVLDRQVSAIKSYWQRQIFSGRAVPPPERPNDEEVLAFVRDRPGAIGYVASSTPVGDLRILRVTE